MSTLTNLGCTASVANASVWSIGDRLQHQTVSLRQWKTQRGHNGWNSHCLPFKIFEGYVLLFWDQNRVFLKQKLQHKTTWSHRSLTSTSSLLGCFQRCLRKIIVQRIRWAVCWKLRVGVCVGIRVHGLCRPQGWAWQALSIVIMSVATQNACGSNFLPFFI